MLAQAAELQRELIVTNTRDGLVGTAGGELVKQLQQVGPFVALGFGLAADRHVVTGGPVDVAWQCPARDVPVFGEPFVGFPGEGLVGLGAVDRDAVGIDAAGLLKGVGRMDL
jgi:hypothetical protein